MNGREKIAYENGLVWGGDEPHCSFRLRLSRSCSILRPPMTFRTAQRVMPILVIAAVVVALVWAVVTKIAEMV